RLQLGLRCSAQKLDASNDRTMKLLDDSARSQSHGQKMWSELLVSRLPHIHAYELAPALVSSPCRVVPIAQFVVLHQLTTKKETQLLELGLGHSYSLCLAN